MPFLPRLAILFSCIVGFSMLTMQQSLAQDLVYRPKNPAFGGNPLNYQWMLSSANNQNLYDGSRGFGYNQDPLARFEESLQRQILSQLTRNLVRDQFGDDFDLSQESNLQFGEFNIDVLPGVDGITIRIFNNTTGEETSITIPNINQ